MNELAESTIRKALSDLSAEERANLKYHLKAKTRILCGEEAALYMDGSGGG